MNDIGQARRPPSGGRLALILAAERLIAQRGLTGVSLREINEAAGLKNVSAAHYHFGSRDGVVEAILAYRLPDIQARRVKLLADLQDAGRQSDPRGLISALVWPLVEEIKPRREGNYYLRFIEQIKRERGDSPLISYGNAITHTWARILNELRAQIKEIPPQISTFRLRLEFVRIVSSLATVENWIEHGEMSPADLPLAGEVVIDAAVSAIVSPPTPEALAHLRGLDG